MTAPGFTVDPDALAGITSRVLSVVDDGDTGDVTAELADAMVFGHAGLHGSLTALTGVVQAATRQLRADAGQIAANVTTAAGQFVADDADAKQALVGAAGPVAELARDSGAAPAGLMSPDGPPPNSSIRERLEPEDRGELATPPKGLTSRPNVSSATLDPEIVAQPYTNPSIAHVLNGGQ